MRTRLLFLGLTFAAASAGAADPAIVATSPPPTPAAATKPATKKPGWLSSLLPKPFQREPMLEMTVFTSMTEAGRKLTPPTREQPAYYEIFAAGYQQEGGTIREHPPPPTELLEAMVKSLQLAGYAPATPDHPPTVMLVQHWGSHNRVDDVVLEEIDPTLAVKNFARRAKLIGGEALASALAKAYEQDLMSPPGFSSGSFSRLAQLRDSSPTMRFLLDQARDDVYFVIATAYDYAAMARSERRLLWRTNMTVNARGVSMKQTLPSVIATATPYFGRETKDALAIAARALPEGKVELGELRVIGEAEDPPVPRPDDAPAPTTE